MTLSQRIANGKPAPVVAWPARAPQPLVVEQPTWQPEWRRRGQSGENRGKLLSGGSAAA